MDADDLAQRTTAYSVLPGMPPIRSVKLPGPLPLPGNGGSYDAVPLGFPYLPPGLPHPSYTVKIQEEVSPLRFSVLSQASHQRHSVLATVPVAPLARQPSSMGPTVPPVK